MQLQRSRIDWGVQVLQELDKTATGVQQELVKMQVREEQRNMNEWVTNQQVDGLIASPWTLTAPT